MLSNPVPPKRCGRDWCWRIAALLLVLASAGLHLGYLAYQCPLNLAPDEAHYWDWSRHLDLSYYSKGPLVAYLIRASCAVAGPLSCQLTGSEMLAVRLPAVLCGSLLLLSLYVLTLQVYRSARLGLLVQAARHRRPHRRVDGIAGRRPQLAPLCPYQPKTIDL